jgi:hypothetical protein
MNSESTDRFYWVTAIDLLGDVRDYGPGFDTLEAAQAEAQAAATEDDIVSSTELLNEYGRVVETGETTLRQTVVASYRWEV